MQATLIDNVLLADRQWTARRPSFTVEVASDATTVRAYRALRREVFVGEQSLFAHDDADHADGDDRTVVLVARDAAGAVVGGVRLGPVVDPSWSGPDIGWWTGSRLVVAPGARAVGGVGAALVRAACAHAEGAGVLRFEATVRLPAASLFARLGWQVVGPAAVGAVPHLRLRWPIERIQTLATATKAPLGDLLDGLRSGPAGLGGAGWVGDDGAPVPGSDLVVASDSILPSMVERDPEWAGWCAVLVNAGDLAAMGAEPVGLTDALGARDASFAARVIRGLRRASAAYRLPVLGGHTQLGVPASLAVTALGRTATPVPAAGGRPGHDVSLTADLGGGWRRGYTGRQWDSSSGRTSGELALLTSMVARTAPAAAKDVSMAGAVGTLGMLAEASGCAAELDVAAVPRPTGATMGDWLTCFPGFAMVTADLPGRGPAAAGPATSATCGRLVSGSGVALVWPDGVWTPGVAGAVTGLGAA